MDASICQDDVCRSQPRNHGQKNATSLFSCDVHDCDEVSALTNECEIVAIQRLKLTVVAANKSIAIVPSLDTIHILLGLLQRDVHISVHGLQLACAVEAEVSEAFLRGA